MPTLTAKLVVHINPEVLGFLKARAKRKGQTLGELVRRMLLAGLTYHTVCEVEKPVETPSVQPNLETR